MQAPLRDRDPRLLGPYVLTARLGRGGMGTVYLGEDESGRRVAVKVINAELADDGEAGVYCHGGFGYAFLLRSDGRARIAKLTTGQAQTVTTGTVPELRDGNRLQAACVKREDGNIDLAMWVNGEPVASSAATPPSSVPGNSGLLVVRSEGATGWPQAVFDDFALCEV